MGGAVVWGRAALRLDRSWRRILRTGRDSANEAAELAKGAFTKGVHNAVLYTVAAVIAFTGYAANSVWIAIPAVLCAVPIIMTAVYSANFTAEADLFEKLSRAEQRALDTLKQEELAPRRWADRLAPEQLPDFQGFEVGQVYEAGSGMMAGDFYDMYMVGPKRMVAVIGDVSGHGIEPAITAFQVKYLLRVFLREYRDPAQALEKLNDVLSGHGGAEEFASLCVALFDQNVGTLRWASAGHPPAWLWHDGEVSPLRSTGPLLTLDPRSTFSSREVALDSGDLLLM